VVIFVADCVFVGLGLLVAGTVLPLKTAHANIIHKLPQFAVVRSISLCMSGVSRTYFCRRIAAW
jgi:hypothetical protein